MNEENVLEKRLKELKRGLWLNPILLIISGLMLCFWLNSQGKWLDFSEKFPNLETHVLKGLNQNTAIVIFLVLLISVLSNTLQIVNMYRLLIVLIDKLKEEND